VLVGGWGNRATELLMRFGERIGSPVQRAGSTGVIGADVAAAGQWRCWISGRATNGVDAALKHSEIGASAGGLLRGTFILVAVDLERDLALISRDQLGGRPLVFARVGDGAVFAEHERAILDLMPSSPGPDRLTVTQWIDGKGIPSGRTFYDGIQRLAPAHRLRLSKDGVAVERYWSPRYQGIASASRPEVVERLRHEVFGAVERAATGSTRTAVRLSGGLDSAAVAAGLAARPSPRSDAIALSAVFPNHPETDESELIEAVAREAGLPSERIAFDDDASFLTPALRHIERWRLPPMTPNLFIWEPVMARARQLGVDVMLDGEGGDELFGLAPYLIADMLRSGRFAKAWLLAGGIPGMGPRPAWRLKLRALRVFGIGGLVPPRIRLWRQGRDLSTVGSVLARPDLEALNENEKNTGSDHLDGPLWWQFLAAQLTDGGDPFDASGHLQREAIDDQVDRRHPFLFDLDLLETILSNPPQLQFDPVRDRSLLRDALAGHIPEQVRNRYAKSYFTPILQAELEGSDGRPLKAALDSDAPIRAFLRPDAEPTDPMGLWRIGMANLWLAGNDPAG
jgi:asparagine synthase (glutamine-hydrolysing)